MDELAAAAASLAGGFEGALQSMKLGEGRLEGDATLLFLKMSKLKQAAQSA